MNGSQKISLSFTKKIEKPNLQPSAFRSDGILQDVKESTELIESIEGNVMKTDTVPEAKELVIPMVLDNRTNILKKMREKVKDISGDLADDEKKSSKRDCRNDKEITNTRIESVPLTLDEQAEAAVLEESKKKLGEWSTRGTTDSLTILQDEQKKSLESSAGKESSLEDYDEVDVAVFGSALLRGMGWNKSEGIGRVNKQVIDVIDPTAKAFGSLSNTPEGSRKKNSSGNEEEELMLMKGSYVFIHSGRHSNIYGTVESIDEDHLFVKAAVSQNIIREIEQNIRVVSQREYKDSSRVINKDMYDKYKEEEEAKKKKQKSYTESNDSGVEEKNKKKDVKLEKLLSKRAGMSAKNEKTETALIDSTKDKINTKQRNKNDLDIHIDKKSSGRNRTEEILRNHSSRSSDNDIYKEKDDRVKYGKYQYDKQRDDKYEISKEKYSSSSRESSNSKSYYYESKHDSNREKYVNKREEYSSSYASSHKKTKISQETRPTIPWVRENLRVRLISKNYKNGKYHKEKIVVKSVDTAESCECITEDGIVLRDVHPEWLETVVPKVDPQIVMIVNGNQKGQKGRILQLHRDQEKASVQMLEDKTTILKLHYDDICEYVFR
ncbi:hypothetical protein SK128_009971 [Halocaridina rubra]|uniref:KOW domain-containing protein n=1 Tax=Halocaridina rubra TaxID=373956 RepID=A0AAN9AHN0_HALRR